MRKPVIDYKQFRLKEIGKPQYRHLLYLLGWIGYFALYFLTERFIPYEACTPVYSPLDDLIPFCEYFVIPYVGWYFLIVGSLLYLMFYNPDNFKNLMKFIIVTQIVAMSIYIIFPNRQDLRPLFFERDNLFTRIVGLLYQADTSTNVCPSLHVGYSIGIASAFLKEGSVSKFTKTWITLFCLSVCLSVAFVKQHSVVDIFAALPMCLLAELIAFFPYWKKKVTRK
ncbi:MAG: phosphatidic acid phosphatase [Oscillospiraceae bacterium]|nr:phosphatidic acid phosphatase [Oscillospiraceae bacterium]